MTIAVMPMTDRAWLRGFFAAQWGEPGVVSRGRLTTADEVSGVLCAREKDEILGCVSWRDEDGEREVVTLNALRPRQGVGTALLQAVTEQSARACRRLWLVTTNDNVDALRFYQTRGWRMVALRPGAVVQSRKLKPSIPETGAYGIPIRDEIELEYPLARRAP